MLKLAEQFFKSGVITISKDVPLAQSDLFIYLKILYKKEPLKLDSGFIKVIETKKSLTLSEHIYYDYSPEIKASYYIGFEGMIDSSKIINSELGFNISKNGFAKIDTSKHGLKKLITQFVDFPYIASEGKEEASGYFRFTKNIWDSIQNSLDHNNYLANLSTLLRNITNFSDILNQADAFDTCFLKWTKGRCMRAHNDLDYRSFINIILYNSSNTSDTRELSIGEYDWYEVTFHALMQNDFSRLMNINSLNKQSFRVQSDVGFLVNTFNPKFFHEAELFNSDGCLYTCTSNRSFKTITDKLNFSW